MTTYSDQEEVEKLKAWWKTYGPALFVGVAIGLALLFGGKYWKEYQARMREEASVLYEQMLQAQRRADRDALRAVGARLVKEYDATPYAAMAALAMARAAIESGDVAGARSQLEWVLAHGRDPVTQHAARLRLGRVLIDAGEADKALALASIAEQGGYTAQYRELKGDALLALGRRDEALAAYKEALAQGAGAGATALTLKLDELSAAAPGAAR